MWPTNVDGPPALVLPPAPLELLAPALEELPPAPLLALLLLALLLAPRSVASSRYFGPQVPTASVAEEHTLSPEHVLPKAPRQPS